MGGLSIVGGVIAFEDEMLQHAKRELSPGERVSDLVPRLTDAETALRAVGTGRAADLEAAGPARVLENARQALRDAQEVLRGLDIGAYSTVALETRVRRSQKIIEHCTQGLLQCRADGTIIDLAADAESAHGLSTPDSLGLKLTDFAHPEDRPIVVALLARAVARPAARVTAVYRTRTGEGLWRWTEAAATSLLHDPDVQSILVTQQDDAREQAAALEVLNQRCAALASELSVFSDISKVVLSGGDVVTALTEALSGCLTECRIASGALYLVNSKDSLRVTTLGPDPGWDPERLSTFFGQEQLLRRVMAWHVTTELPSPVVPAALSAEILKHCGASAAVIVPLHYEGELMGACLLVSRVRSPNQDAFFRFAGGVGNQATQILALATVLAEKERLRRDAAEQARLMRLILDSMTEGVLVVDRDRRVLLQNRTTMALAPAEIGSSIVGHAEQFGLFHPDGKTLLSPEDGPLFRAANGETLDDAEICLRPPGTDQLTRFHVTARPLITDSGELRGGMVVLRDITEQKRAEHEILVSRSQWQSLVEHAPDFIMNVDREGKVRFINRVAPGFNLDDVIGMRLGADVPPEQQDRIQRALESCINRGEGTEYEVSAPRSDGSLRWYSCVLGPVRRNGEITGAVVIARDITEKKLTDSLMVETDRMASVGALAAGIAHEINSPLASLFVNLTLATRDAEVAAAGHDLAPTLLEELKDAREAAERVRQIVSDLRIFTGWDGERLGPVDVEELLETTLRTARYEIRHRARVETHYDKVPLIRADGARLGQVFLNLVLNATQAIPEGNPAKNEIRVSSSVDSAGRVVVRVADTGEGIPLELQPRVFTPLLSTKPRAGVMALGLSVCKRIVTELGGEISFTSEPGKGTEFSVVLPASPFVEIQSQAASKSAPVPAEVRRGRVLVIDDEPAVAAAMKRVLSPEHDITVVDSGARALELIQSGAHFDAIFCDVLMPQMSGIDLYETVSRVLPDQAKRFVFVTGGSFTARAQDFLDTVPNPHVEKPFHIATLRSIISDSMRRT
jgi:PAS domain S-box-containing protein